MSAKEYGHDEQFRAAWDFALAHRCRSSQLSDAERSMFFEGFDLGVRGANLNATSYGAQARDHGVQLASKQAEYVQRRPDLRCDDPHETSVMIAASHGQWVSRAELWRAVQPIEGMSLLEVDKHRKALQATGRIIATRLGNQTFYVGAVRPLEDA